MLDIVNGTYLKIERTFVLRLKGKPKRL